MHKYYNTGNFPTLIATGENWDIYANEAGHLASIPNENGCKASAFGDSDHLKRLIMKGGWGRTLTAAGKKLVAQR